jgi:hypothetical protein
LTTTWRGPHRADDDGYYRAVRPPARRPAGWNAPVPGIGTLVIIGPVAVGRWPRIAEYR